MPSNRSAERSLKRVTGFRLSQPLVGYRGFMLIASGIYIGGGFIGLVLLIVIIVLLLR
jgi:hypothetical protein